MTYRHQFQNKVDLFSKFFLAKQHVNPFFTFIPNANISSYDICHDRIHLNFKGVIKLANNFLDVVNRVDSL